MRSAFLFIGLVCAARAALPTTNLVGRYIAGTGQTTDGGSLISQWDDQSGSGNHLVQATAGSRPTATKDLFGAPIVRFGRIDATNGDRTMTSTAPTLSSRALSIWIVSRGVTQANQALGYNVGYAGGSANLRILSSTTLAAGIYSVSVASTLRWSMNRNIAGIVAGASSTVVHTAATSSTLAAVTSGNGTGGFQLGAFGAVSYSAMDVYEVLVYNAAQSAQDQIDTKAYLVATYGIQTSFIRRLVFEGDSITAGSLSTDQQTYPFQIASRSNPYTWEMFNQSSSGATISTLTTRATATDALISGGLRNVLVLMIGRNDASTTAGATIYSNLVTYCQARVAAGWEVWVCTCIATSNGTIQTRLTDLNTLIRSSIIADAGVARVVDCAASTYFDPGSAGDLVYYNSDGTHLTNLGYTKLADIIEAVYSAPHAPRQRAFPLYPMIK